MSTSIHLDAASVVTMMTTELNSLANGSGKTQATGTNAAYDNSLAANLHFWADFQLNVTFGSAPTDNSTVELYLVPSMNGTYEPTTDGASPVVDLGNYVGAFNIRGNTAQQLPMIRGAPLGPWPFKLYVINRSGQAFPASGSTVVMMPYREASG